MMSWMFNTRGEVVQYTAPKNSKKHAGRKAFGILFKNKELATLARDRTKKVFERIHAL